MGFSIKTTTKVEDVADFVANAILNQLKSGKKVLFFVPGGSSIDVAVKVAEILRGYSHQNLTVTLTDERYGPIDHFNSNYFQLLEKGFSLPEAKLIPVLIDEDCNITTEKFNAILKEELKSANYKIGLFGIGVDGHTAGILPDSIVVQSQDLVCSYDTPVFSRITITPKVIEKLDEAVVWAQGAEKWEVLKELNKEVDINLMPAQILKKVPLLTIFTNFEF